MTPQARRAERAERVRYGQGLAAQAERLAALIDETEELQFREALAPLLAEELRREDAGWSKYGATADGYDLAPAELAKARARCVTLWQVDATVGRAAELLAEGSIGQGVAPPRSSDTAVDKVIKQTWNDPLNQGTMFSQAAMIDASNRLVTEGELFFAIHTKEGDPDVVLTRWQPGEIVSVITAPENKTLPIAYLRETQPVKFNHKQGTWEPDGTTIKKYYKAAMLGEPDEEVEKAWEAIGVEEDVAVHHVRVNTLGLRGIPEAYRALDWARSHAQALSSLVTLARALATLAWKVKVATKNSANLTAAAAAFRDPAPGVGSTVAESQNIDHTPVDVGTGGTSNNAMAVRHSHLETLRAFPFGEHWYGDASTGNLATATAMEMPAIWALTARQKMFDELFRFVLDFALLRATLASSAGVGPGPWEYDIDFEPVQPRNENVLGIFLTGLSAATTSGIIDPREASYQAYQALGSNEIETLLEAQYPGGELPAEPAPETMDAAEAAGDEAKGPPFQPGQAGA